MVKLTDVLPACADEPLDPRFPKSPSKLKMYNEAVEAYKREYERYSTDAFDSDLKGEVHSAF